MPKPIEFPFKVPGLMKAIQQQDKFNTAIGVGKKAQQEVNAVYGQTEALTVKELKLIKQVQMSQGERFETLIESERALRKDLNLEKNRLELAQDYFAHTEKGTEAHKTANGILGKQKKLVSDITKRYDQLADRIKGTKDPLSKILSGTPLRYLISMVDKMKEFNRAFESIGKRGGMGEVLVGYLNQATKSASLFSKGAGLAFKGGLVIGLQKALPLLKIVGVALKGFAMSLLPFVATAALVVAGLFLIKKMWDFNIGGLQTGFFQIIGDMQSIWGRFIAALSKSLTKISPLVKVLLGGPFLFIRGVLKVVSSLLQGFFIILDPIFTALGEIGEALISPFQAFLPEGKKTTGFFELLGKTVVFISKIIAGALTLILFPIKLITTLLKLVSTPLDKLSGGMKVFGIIAKIAFFPLIVQFKAMQITFALLGKGISIIGNAFKTLFAPIGILIDKIKEKFMSLVDVVKSLLAPIMDFLGPIIKVFQKLSDIMNKITGKKGLIAEGGAEKTTGKFAGFSRIDARPERERVAGLMGTDAKKQTEKAVVKREIQQASISTQQTIQNVWNRHKTIDARQNNTVNIHPSGPLDEKSAPRVGDIIVSLLNQQKTMG